ncbi:MAG: chorismate mutase [Gaiellales bacterium]
MSDRFDEIRGEITANDHAIVEAVNRRLDLVAELWAIKQNRGLDRTDPDRERLLLEALAGANQGPLSRDGLDELVRWLLALTRNEIERRADPRRG